MEWLVLEDNQLVRKSEVAALAFFWPPNDGQPKSDHDLFYAGYHTIISLKSGRTLPTKLSTEAIRKQLLAPDDEPEGA